MKFVTDAKVTGELLALIDSASKYVILVSPYVKFWPHLSRAFQAASKRGVRLIFIVRSGDSESEKWKHWELIEDEGLVGAEIYVVDWLHSKVYLNESTAMISSMNLLTSSSQGSLETALIVHQHENDKLYKEIIAYAIDLRKHAIDSSVRPRTSATQPSKAAATAKGDNAGKIAVARGARTSGDASADRRVTHRRASMASADIVIKAATCIRCGGHTVYDVNRPLCRTCYAVWRNYGDPLYLENFCHACGKEDDTSFARPECLKCYRKPA